jgi:HlyD family secretion protein
MSGCSDKEETGRGEAVAARQVSFVEVQSRALAGGLIASGVLAAREEAAVASELAGFRVAEVLFEEGELVRVGQPMVRLDPALLQSEIAQLSANLTQQRAQASQADREARRVSGLEDDGVLALETIEQRQTAARRARAAVSVAEAQLQEARTRLGRLTIAAPVSGRILARNVRPGDIAAAGGEPMFRIARGGLVELHAELPEGDLAGIRPGHPVELQLPSGGKVLGKVRAIDAEIDGQTRLGTIRIQLPPGPHLRPGGFASARFVAASRPVPAVPEQALRYDAQGVSVMALDGSSRARRVPVKTGRRADGWVELVSGPRPGTRLLLGGGAFVVEGDLVRANRARLAPSSARPGSSSAPGKTAG